MNLNEGMETGPYERYFLGSHAILQSKNMTSRYIKYAEYAEYAEYSTVTYMPVRTLHPDTSVARPSHAATSASVRGMYFGNIRCSEVEVPRWIMK
jgi:hypothetical protein